jgi:ribonuclease HI
MKRSLNTIPLSKRKHFMSNFFLPRTNNKKPVVSKTPFVGYEMVYCTNKINQKIDTIAKETPDKSIIIDSDSMPLPASLPASSLSLPASVTNPFAMFKNPNTPSSSGMTHPVTTPLQTLETYKLAFDGCSKGNPGKAGAGAVIYEGAAELWSDARYVGDKETNNVAEYTGLIMGLHEALRRNIARLLVQGDSELIIKQMKGEYAVKSDNIRNYHATAKGLAAQFKWIEFRHVYRKDNKRADELSNQGLNKA